MKTKLLIIILFISNNIFSQVNITGNITTSTKEEIYYDVLIYSKDSILITGNSFFTSSFNFQVPTIEKGTYIKISSLGYKAFISPLQVKSNVVNLGTIYLKENINELTEIVIVGKEKFVENNNGNIKFNVANSSLSTMGTGIDLVEKLPGIVMNNGKIHILGRGTPLIIIDGVESTQQDLNNLNSDQIANLEILKSTSAEYSASANSVIKVLTLTQKFNGWNFNLSNQITKSTFYRYYSGLNIMYKKNKSAYSFYFGANPNKIRHKDNFIRHFNDLGYRVENEIIRDTKNPHDYDLILKTNQEINDVLKFKFQTYNSFNKIEDITQNTNILFYNNTNDKISTQINNPIQTINHRDNLIFEFLLDSLGRSIKLRSDYAFYKEENNQNIIQLSNEDKINKQTKFNNIANSFSINPHLKLPNSFLKTNIIAGIRFSGLRSKSIYSFLETNENTIKENIFASYFQIEKDINKFHYQIGLRYEFAKSEAYDNSGSKIFNRKYNNFFPNASVQYSINKDLKTSLSYAYKIKRPNLYDITSYNIFIDSLTSFQGNPKLLPEFSYVFDYSLSYKGLASLSFSYIKTKNPIFYFIDYQGLTTTAYKDNFDSSDNYTFSLNLPYQKGIWTIFNSFGYVIQQNKYIEKDINIKNSMFYVAIYNKFDIKKWFQFDVLYKYNSNGLLGMLAFEPRHIVTININRYFWNKKINIYFQVNDIFNKDLYNLSTKVRQLEVNNYKFNDQQRIRFGIVFKLNQLDNYIKSVDNNKENERRIKRE